MRVCFPVSQDLGVESELFGHFGSAPVFVVVDMATESVSAITNSNRVHAEGGCNPLAGIGGVGVEAVVVGEIGRGALQKLTAAGVRVYQAQGGTVADNLARLRSSGLSEFTPGKACGGHGHGHGRHGQGCSH